MGNLLGKPHKVILYNDSHHPTEMVSFQIMQAINCDYDTATKLINVAEEKGQVEIFTGSKERCELVYSILRGIDLNINVVPIQ